MNYVDRTNKHLLEKVEERNGNAVFVDRNAAYPTVIICNPRNPLLIPTGHYSSQRVAS